MLTTDTRWVRRTRRILGTQSSNRSTGTKYSWSAYVCPARGPISSSARSWLASRLRQLTGSPRRSSGSTTWRRSQGPPGSSEVAHRTKWSNRCDRFAGTSRSSTVTGSSVSRYVTALTVTYSVG